MSMKDSTQNATDDARLLDLPYTPEAEAFLDELERSGQFRVGIDAELDDAETVGSAVSNDYALTRGGGSVSVQDWWTSGRVSLRVGAGISSSDIALARDGDSLVVCLDDSADRVALEGYLGLIPDASTLRILFADGAEWTGGALAARIAAPAQGPN